MKENLLTILVFLIMAIGRCLLYIVMVATCPIWVPYIYLSEYVKENWVAAKNAVEEAKHNKKIKQYAIDQKNKKETSL